MCCPSIITRLLLASKVGDHNDLKPLTNLITDLSISQRQCQKELISLLLNGNASQITGSVLEAAYCNHLREKYVVEAVLNSGGDRVLERIKQWIDRQPEPIRNKAGKELGQLMMIAASKGHKRVVQMLLKSGVSARMWDNVSQRTALRCAAEYGHDAVLGLLLESGADSQAEETNSLKTALRSAAERGSVGVEENLLARGADIHAKDGDQMTAIHRQS